jgi:hypothetical protein
MGLKLNSSSGGSVTLQEPTTASNYTLSLPAQTGTIVSTDSSGNVGVGTTSPSLKLHVKSSSNDVLMVESTNTYSFLDFTNPTGTAGIGNSGNFMRFDTGGTERMRIDSSGRVTMPYQPAFLAGFTSSGTVSLGDATVIPFNAVSGGNCYDTGGNFNTSSNRFTAPVTGTYVFSVGVKCQTTGGYSVTLYKNGSGITNSQDGIASFAQDLTMVLVVALKLSAGDYVEARTRNGSYTVYKNHTYWSGYLIG